MKPVASSATLVITAALALTSCSSGPPQGPETTAGPLTSILEGLTAGYDHEYYAAKQIEIENSIAECMTVEGFEYVPQDDAGTSIVVDTDDFAGEDTEEWVAKNGYGMAMVLDQPLKERVDLNADYVASLSEAESAAYQIALGGTADELQAADPEYVYRWEDAGCWGAAAHVAYAEQDVQAPQLADLWDDLAGIGVAVSEDPRVARLSDRWSDCMADAGYTGLATPDDAEASVRDAFNALYRDVSLDTGPPEADAAEFRELELATAMADFTCRRDVGWGEAVQTVQLELEEAYVKDNKATLDEIVAEVEAARQPIG